MADNKILCITLTAGATKSHATLAEVGLALAMLLVDVSAMWILSSGSPSSRLATYINEQNIHQKLIRIIVF